ncbi:MAG: hypothetical protein FWE33_06425 [Defluviitaleaceae bacterium]|nr:hypothetical protein [Defluviitaleaceae bacterium]
MKFEEQKNAFFKLIEGTIKEAHTAIANDDAIAVSAALGKLRGSRKSLTEYGKGICKERSEELLGKINELIDYI